MNLEVVTLEDNVEYAIVKEINNYLLLVNTSNEEDWCIRKNVTDGDQKVITPLDNDEEFDKALALFND